MATRQKRKGSDYIVNAEKINRVFMKILEKKYDITIEPKVERRNTNEKKTR